MMDAPEPLAGADKLAFIIFEGGTEAEVIQILDELGLEHYTAFEQIKGTGETGRKEGNAIFPGINNILMVAMPREKIAPLVERLHIVRDSYIVQPGMKVIVTDCVMY